MDRIDQILDIEKAKQDEQDQETDTIDGILVFCRDGTAHDDFDHRGKDAPAIQGRDGQQVYHANRDGQRDDDQQGVVGGELGLTGWGPAARLETSRATDCWNKFQMLRGPPICASCGETVPAMTRPGRERIF